MYVVYTRDDCEWCEKAKDLLRIYGHDFITFNIEDDKQHAKFLKDGGFKTVPQIFYNGYYIGNYSGLDQHLKVEPAPFKKDKSGEYKYD